MTDREILEIIPEPFLSRMLAWLDTTTGTITFTVQDGVIVDMELVEHAARCLET